MSIDLTSTPIGRWGAQLTKEAQNRMADLPVTIRYADLQVLIKRSKLGKKKKGKSLVLPVLEVDRILPLRQATADEVRAAVRLFNDFGLPAAEVPSVVSGALMCANITCSEHEAMEMQAETIRNMAKEPLPVGHCIQCEVPVFEHYKETLVCSEECFEAWQKEKEAADKFLAGPEQPPIPAALPPVEQADEEPQAFPEGSDEARIAGMVASLTVDKRLSVGVADCLKYVQLRNDGLDGSGIQKSLKVDAHELSGLRRTLDSIATAYRLQEDGRLRKLILDLLRAELIKKGVKP